MDKTRENKQLFNRMARWYDSFFVKLLMKKFQKPVLNELTFNKTKILDVGCGTGELLKSINKKDVKLCGIDLSEEMIKKAKKKLSFVSLHVADVHNLPFKDNSFDYVINTESFHHYVDQKKALKEMYRVAKNKVVVVDIEFVFKLLNKLFQKVETGCVKVNNKNEMRKLFEDVGFKKIKQKRNFFFTVMNVGYK